MSRVRAVRGRGRGVSTVPDRGVIRSPMVEGVGIEKAPCPALLQNPLRQCERITVNATDPYRNNPVRSFEDIPGWFSFPQAYDQVVNRYADGIMVEVGCYLGRSLCYLAEKVTVSKKPFQLVGVDHCKGSGIENGRDNHGVAVRAGGGSFAAQLYDNVSKCGFSDLVSLLLCDSIRASKLFADNSLTMVFIDAAHDYDAVAADIRAWAPKVKPGGVLMGDDMGVPGETNPIWPGVTQAVKELLPGFHYVPHAAWGFIKP